MWTRRLVLPWIALCLLCSVAVSAPAPRVAKVLDVVGRGEVLQRGKVVPVRTLLRLDESDEISLPRAARVRLVYASDQHWEALLGPCRVRVTAQRGRLISGHPQALRRISASSPALNAPVGNLERMGGLTFRSLNPGVRPTMKHAVVGPPRFTWETAEVGPFEVNVFQSGGTGGASPQWTGRTEGRELLYSGPALPEDRIHGWSVTVRPAGLQPTFSRVQPGWTFAVLSPRSQAEVARGEQVARALLEASPEDPAGYVMLLDFYADHYMLEEAVQAGLDALSRRPDDAGIHLALARLYAEMGDLDRAAAARERAGLAGLTEPEMR